MKRGPRGRNTAYVSVTLTNRNFTWLVLNIYLISFSGFAYGLARLWYSITVFCQLADRIDVRCWLDPFVYNLQYPSKPGGIWSPVTNRQKASWDPGGKCLGPWIHPIPSGYFYIIIFILFYSFNQNIANWITPFIGKIMMLCGFS